MEGRASIAIDLSPAATFITKNYCTPVDVAELEQAFAALQAKVKPEMDWLYETRCDRCEGRATTAYTVYSYGFQCPRCLEKVALFDCVEVEGETVQGKPKKINVCPHCYARGHVEEISTRSERFAAEPVLVSYLCQEGCKPQRDERRHNDPNEKKRDFFARYDLAKLAEIEAKEIPYWTPPHRMMNVESDTESWGDKWRAGTSNFRTVSDLYPKQNFWGLAIIRKTIKQLVESEIADALMFCWNSITLNVSRMTTDRDRLGFLKGTYYIPQVHRCTNVWGTFENKFRLMKGGWANLNEIDNPRLIVSTQSVLDMNEVPDNTVDLIFTDPPYADKEQYGELNFVWEAWFDFNTNWHDDEIIVNQTRGKGIESWAYLLGKAMYECYRVLKPGRWLSLCYHDTSEGTWHLIQDIMTEVGFIPEQIENTLYIDTGQKSYNQKTAEKVTKRDLVINFRKPRPGELAQPLTLSGDEDATTFSQKATAILREALELHPGTSADRLYDELVSRMVRQGRFERHNFDALLRTVAEPVEGRWYLLETADQVDAAESAKEDAAADYLTTSMNHFLAENPAQSGVHYSDPFEQYLPLKDKPRRLLQGWLPEYFYRTVDGGWRPPVNAEEQTQKAALRTSGTLRRIKRFTNALLEGVPPADRDRPESLATVVDWLRQCRRAGLYERGRAIYEKGGFDFNTLPDETLLAVEEDYQLCVRRSGA